MNSGRNTDKERLRERLLAARDAVGPLAEASAAVTHRLATLPELAVVKTVLGYAATKREVSVDAALEALLARGTTVCLPWVDGTALGVAVVTSLSALEPGWRGVREPPAAGRRPLRPSALDALVVPGVGFDATGNRLGYGGGHFDRLLARVRRDAVVIGVALDEQVCGSIPTEAHDRRVDVLVTPTRTVRPAV